MAKTGLPASSVVALANKETGPFHDSNDSEFPHLSKIRETSSTIRNHYHYYHYYHYLRDLCSKCHRCWSGGSR